MKPYARANVLRVTLLLCVSFCTCLWALPAQAALSSEQQMFTHNVQTVPTPQEILARARIWTSMKVAYDRYPPYNGPDNYRKDCSGMVSMAWGLPNNPNGGLNTDGLATVSHPILKNQLQAGDILLNTKEDAHVVIFGGWLNADKVSYDALEENGDSADGYGYAVEHAMPYPYYQGYFPEDYVPMRINGSVVNSPAAISKPTSVVKQPPPTAPVPIPAPTPTQTVNFSPFVGSWYAHSRLLDIKSDGHATYKGRTFLLCGSGVVQPCDDTQNLGNTGMNTTVVFTTVSTDGKTISGTITSGTGDRNLNPDRLMPVGSTITAALQADDKGNDTLLQVSDGWLLCSQNVSTTDPHYTTDCTSGA